MVNGSELGIILNALAFEKDVQQRIFHWMTHQATQDMHREILDLLECGDREELCDRFAKTLSFGTGGVRALLGAGTNRLNRYSVLCVAHALCSYMVKRYSAVLRMVIGYDSRQCSKDFAEIVAAVCAEYAIVPMLFDGVRPTPFVSLAVLSCGASMGVMVTASHNPPEYNGLKVFVEYGGQILSPDDQELQGLIDGFFVGNLVEKPLKKSVVHYLDERFDEIYYKTVQKVQIYPQLLKSWGMQLHIAYTALHGVGYAYVRELLQKGGCVNLHVVDAQICPDASFPTLSAPNPEDPDAWTLVLQRAEETRSDLVFVTDPDADRLGVAVRCQNAYHVLSGNQLGIMLSYYILSQLAESQRLPRNGFLVKTLVSSDLVRYICEDFGVELIEVLTGFKYISQQIAFWTKNQAKKKEYIFAFEESCGYNASHEIPEKDGVASTILVAELWAFCAQKGINILEYLDQIYSRYGYSAEHTETRDYPGSTGQRLIHSTMQYFRTLRPKIFCGYRVDTFTDCLNQNSIGIHAPNERFLSFPISDVLIFELQDNIRVILRPSGTESKLKCYFSYFYPRGAMSLEQIKSEAEKILLRVRNLFIQEINCIEREETLFYYEEENESSNT